MKSFINYSSYYYYLNYFDFSLYLILLDFKPINFLIQLFNLLNLIAVPIPKNDSIVL